MTTEGQNFSEALATWKGINLVELQKTMDAQGLELVENQKESLVGRKGLADKTKEFKKIPDEGKANAFKTLLKAYQTEIDNLTRRSKTSENAFLHVYKLLAEAPDPYPLLDVAVDQTIKVAEVKDLEAGLQRLREENAELKSRLGEVTTLENSKKKAESRIVVLEEKMDSMIQERVAAKENELNATYDERMMNYEERERDLHRQVALFRGQLRDLQTSTESTQAKLFDQNQRQDQEAIAKLSEMDMVAVDLERANGRVAAVERRNEILRAEIEAVRSGNDNLDRVKSLENQVAELEAESARLLHNLETQKQATSAAEHAISKKVEEFAKDLAAKRSEVAALRNKVQQYGDYDEIKRELEIMKYVEFSGGADAEDEFAEDDVQLPNPNAEKANKQQGKSLEHLLLAKNRRILEELTKFRIMHGELEASLQAVSDSLDMTRAELDKQLMLNEKLENDLIQVNQHSSSRRTGDHAASTLGLINGTPANSSHDGLSGLDLGAKSFDRSRVSSPIPFASSADTSILPIVTSQRDRFRQRNAELEEELRKQFEIISELRTEIKTLQADNMKLYEKVRYMQSYRNEASAGPSAYLSTSAAPISTRSDDMGKYKSMYEESMNPFEAFRGREAARAVQSLNPIERGVFVVTRQVLGNRRARTAFIVYALTLHLLVMFTTYSCATSSPEAKHISPPL